MKLTTLPMAALGALALIGMPGPAMAGATEPVTLAMTEFAAANAGPDAANRATAKMKHHAAHAECPSTDC